MSVLIKGMEMPETCSDCEWSYYIGNGRAMCKRVSMTDKTDIMTKRRADFCPLIEVPTPHGRLIDADKFKADHSMKNDCAECEKKLQGSSRSCEYDRIYSKMDFCEWIDNAATVIEAEE